MFKNPKPGVYVNLREDQIREASVQHPIEDMLELSPLIPESTEWKTSPVHGGSYGIINMESTVKRFEGVHLKLHLPPFLMVQHIVDDSCTIREILDLVFRYPAHSSQLVPINYREYI